MDTLRALRKHVKGIDHLAIAVSDLDKATEWYTAMLGFEAEEEKLAQGATSAMRSRVVRAGPLKFVLVQGTTPTSNVSRYIDAFGPGAQHVALLVENIEAVVEDLKDTVGFDTHIIVGPNLKQAFTHRDEVSGMVWELVERGNFDGFQDANVQQLLDALEAKENF